MGSSLTNSVAMIFYSICCHCVRLKENTTPNLGIPAVLGVPVVLRGDLFGNIRRSWNIIVQEGIALRTVLNLTDVLTDSLCTVAPSPQKKSEKWVPSPIFFFRGRGAAAYRLLTDCAEFITSVEELGS